MENKFPQERSLAWELSSSGVWQSWQKCSRGEGAPCNPTDPCQAQSPWIQCRGEWGEPHRNLIYGGKSGVVPVASGKSQSHPNPTTPQGSSYRACFPAENVHGRRRNLIDLKENLLFSVAQVRTGQILCLLFFLPRIKFIFNHNHGFWQVTSLQFCFSCNPYSCLVYLYFSFSFNNIF